MTLECIVALTPDEVVARARNVTNHMSIGLNIGPNELRFGGRHENVDPDVRVSDPIARERKFLAAARDDHF